MEDVINKLPIHEQFILWVCRENKKEKKQEINRRFNFLFWDIRFSWRSSKNLWGRFGGGWNWKLGVQIGGTTTIISLFVCEFVINKRPKQQHLTDGLVAPLAKASSGPNGETPLHQT